MVGCVMLCGWRLIATATATVTATGAVRCGNRYRSSENSGQSGTGAGTGAEQTDGGGTKRKARQGKARRAALRCCGCGCDGCRNTSLSFSSATPTILFSHPIHDYCCTHSPSTSSSSRLLATSRCERHIAAHSQSRLFIIILPLSPSRRHGDRHGVRCTPCCQCSVLRPPSSGNESSAAPISISLYH